MSQPSDLDPKAVRLQFSRRVGRMAGADFLLREIERRMLERLELVRIEPECVLDAGCGLGHGAARLQQRYPRASVLGVDLALPMAAAAARLHGEQARRSLSDRLRSMFGGAAVGAKTPVFAACDAARLGLRGDSVDLLWSNLVWHWLPDPLAAIDEWRRVMRAGGLLMFSAFGVDTLAELRPLGLRLPAFPDMHDIGDALLKAGFAEPVIDAERLSVTWDDPDKLVAELSALGGDASPTRRKGLVGRSARAALRDRIATLAGADGRIAISFEIVYGHAWAPARSSLPAGYAPVSFSPRRPTPPV